MKKLFWLIFLCSLILSPCFAQIITTVVGNGIAGYSGDGGQASAAELIGPAGIVFDPSGNLYLVDCVNDVIRKVNTLGIITTIAGNGYKAGTAQGGYSGDGGPATSAEFYTPAGICLDIFNNIYIADYGNNVIRKVSTTGIITTVVGNGYEAGTGFG